MQGYPKHYCGVFGIYGHPNAAELTYYGLYALQHRGQESAGIVSCDGRQFHEHKRMGLVSQIFNGERPARAWSAHMAIGHTRYSTTGSSHLRNAQPLTGGQQTGPDRHRPQRQPDQRRQIARGIGGPRRDFQTTVDSEIILHLLAQPTTGGNENNLVQTVRRIEGAYSLVIMTEQELIGVRDPFGFRPLCLGRVGDAWVLASETCALDLISAKFERDIEPGEIVIIDKNGLRSLQAFPEHKQRAPFASLSMSISRGPTAPSPIATSIRCAWKWGANWPGNIPSRPTWWCPCPTAATARRWVIRWRRASPTRWPSCATTTSAAVFSSPRN